MDFVLKYRAGYATEPGQAFTSAFQTPFRPSIRTLMAGLIYKICDKSLWEAAVRSGTFEGAPIDLKDGYIHFSTAGQVERTVAVHFFGQSNLTLVAVDPELLDDRLKYETSRGGDLFPHLYAKLPISAVKWSSPLPLTRDGKHVFPNLQTGIRS